jgi:hypothetical protein
LGSGTVSYSYDANGNLSGWSDTTLSATLVYDANNRKTQETEITDKEQNPRFIVTNIEGDKQALYDELYCPRGDMEREACP